MKGDLEGMGLVSKELIDSNENLSRDELKELLGISERTLKYYKEIGLLKKTRTKRKGKYTLSPRDINFLSFVRDLRRAGLPLSEVKKVQGIRNIFETNDRIKLLKLNTLLKELFEKIEFKRRELEQLRKDIMDFKDDLKNSNKLSGQNPEIRMAKRG